MTTERDQDRGQRIKQLRREHGYTSGQALAEAIGVHPRSVSNWEAGKPIDGPNLARLAEVLDTTPGFIWTGKQDEPADPVSVIRARVDRLEGKLAQHDGDRAVALRAHDKRVLDELAQIREQLEALARSQRESALLLPDLAAEVRELRLAVQSLPHAGASDSQSEANS